MNAVVSRGSLGAEKRRHERIPVTVSSWFSPADRYTAGGRGMLVDISLGGCRIETRFVDHLSQYREGDAVLVRFPAGRGGLELTGSIMWIRQVGALDSVGVRFRKLSLYKSLPLRQALTRFKRTLIVEAGG